MAGTKEWALILGASSGFGEAASLTLAKAGVNIIGVHLDRKNTQANADRIVDEIKKMGREVTFFNANAADEAKMDEIVAEIEKKFQAEPGSHLRVVLHSLAFGTLKPFITDNPQDAISKAQMDMTVDVMAHSLVYWVQRLVRKKLLGKGGHIYAMTSAGSGRVWKTYGAVSAAKASLESHIRQLALECAPYGITANAIMAGVTDTPALRKIPGNEYMIEAAKKKNPGGRCTTPEDIAKAIVAFSNGQTAWMTGNTIRIDGGENIVE
jgi:NAD(P)-dependent dehydrogenase (short-subunit alcohol dehydrogenase family)